MDSQQRREAILDHIIKSQRPIKGSQLAKVFGVSRQVIVQDIALLRAGGNEIIATPQGYMIPKTSTNRQYRRVIVCQHSDDGMEDELMTIVSFGGTIIDVVVEHEVYGEFKAELMISSPYEVRNFVKVMKGKGVRPLSYLREGIHLHTIEAQDPIILDKIEIALKEKGYLLIND